MPSSKSGATVTTETIGRGENRKVDCDMPSPKPAGYRGTESVINTGCANGQPLTAASVATGAEAHSRRFISLIFAFKIFTPCWRSHVLAINASIGYGGEVGEADKGGIDGEGGATAGAGAGGNAHGNVGVQGIARHRVYCRRTPERGRRRPRKTDRENGKIRQKRQQLGFLHPIYGCSLMKPLRSSVSPRLSTSFLSSRSAASLPLLI